MSFARAALFGDGGGGGGGGRAVGVGEPGGNGEPLFPDEAGAEALPEPMERYDFDKIDQDAGDVITDPTWCPFCHLARTRANYAGNNNWDMITRYQDESRSYVDFEIYAKEMKYRYKKYVQEHLIHPETCKPWVGPDWSARSIYDHPITHMRSTLGVLEMAAKCLTERMKRLQENGIFLQNNGIDMKKADAYDKTLKQLLPILKQLDDKRNADLIGPA